jgi:hypothetical protein
MQAVKHAVANSVRLCVVAPTVNVHVSDEKFKLQSGWVDDIVIVIILSFFNLILLLSLFSSTLLHFTILLFLKFTFYFFVTFTFLTNTRVLFSQFFINFLTTFFQFSPYNRLLPNSIRDFIVYEVLSNYTFLFNQIQENSGPEGKTYFLIVLFYSPVFLFLIKHDYKIGCFFLIILIMIIAIILFYFNSIWDCHIIFFSDLILFSSILIFN